MVGASPIQINDISFDNSDSVIFISTSNTAENTVNIKKGLLKNPDRIYFDIDNAIFAPKTSSYNFSNGQLDNLKIAQFSLNPAVVRVVLTYNSKLNPKDVNIISVGGSIIVKLNNYKPSQDFLTTIYREVRSSSYDYFAKVKVNKVVSQEQQESENNKIVLPLVEPQKNNSTLQSPKMEPVRINPPIKESKLQSRFFISKAFVKDGALLLSGTGIVNLEKVFYLKGTTENPNLYRVVFDIPNSTTSANVRNQIFKLNENETARIGQFESTKTRVVITTPYPDKYLAIYSNDLQNILIAKEDKVQDIKLFSNVSNLVNTKVTSTANSQNEIINISLDFNDSIINSIKRRKNSVDIFLYNVSIDYPENLAKKIKTVSSLGNVEVSRIGTVGIKITIPIKSDTVLEGLENLTATKFVLKIKTPVVQKALSKKNFEDRIIVLDAGHGGYDVGATRDQVYEKNLTLDIAKLVERNLKSRGATVIMTRSDDTFVSLGDRVILSNNKEPDVFVSIHINASENPDAHGIETHYYKDDSLDFAKTIHSAIISKIEETNRGILKSRFYVIRFTKQPSVLLELGFISNEEERTMLQNKERQEKFAEAITEGIYNYLVKYGKKRQVKNNG
jgi:N-acetylmuramoyl-L-alanine amidase